MGNDEILLKGEESYYKLPVIYWKEILQEQPKGVWNRRPAKMHKTLNLYGATVWIERCFGIPREKIQFVGVDERDLSNMTIADLQNLDE
jgi:hypothetical protein